jgi:hypothetical protein
MVVDMAWVGVVHAAGLDRQTGKRRKHCLDFTTSTQWAVTDCPTAENSQ